jgi:hypothetical protein
MRFFIYKMQEEVEECKEQEVCKPVTNLVCNTVMKKVIFTVLLHNVAAHNVNITGRVCYLT